MAFGVNNFNKKDACEPGSNILRGLTREMATEMNTDTGRSLAQSQLIVVSAS